MEIRVKRNSIETDLLTLVKLEKEPDFNCDEIRLFNCEDDDLNEFFQKDALEHKKELITETYICKPTSAKGILSPFALISFCNDSIDNSAKFIGRGKDRVKVPKNEMFFKEVVQKNIQNTDFWEYPQYPAVKIARLGVHKGYKGCGIGSFLLEMTKCFFLNDNRTGCRFLTVDANNEPQILNFYRINGFEPLIAEPAPDKEPSRQITLFFDLTKYEPASYVD